MLENHAAILRTEHREGIKHPSYSFLNCTSPKNWQRKGSFCINNQKLNARREWVNLHSTFCDLSWIYVGNNLQWWLPTFQRETTRHDGSDQVSRSASLICWPSAPCSYWVLAKWYVWIKMCFKWKCALMVLNVVTRKWKHTHVAYTNILLEQFSSTFFNKEQKNILNGTSDIELAISRLGNSIGQKDLFVQTNSTSREKRAGRSFRVLFIKLNCWLLFGFWLKCKNRSKG